MTSSNLSKIKTAFRTTGRITGNFNKPKVKSGSPLNDIGLTDAKVINIVTQDAYLNRMYEAFNKTDDPKLKHFCFTQIRNILIQRNLWQ